MITDDGRGYAPQPDDDAPFVPPRVPGPAALDRDYHDARSPGTMRIDWHREQLAALGAQPEPETDRERVLREDRTARYERMIWRNVFLGLYVFGILAYTVWALQRTGITWNLSAFLVLIGGGMIPGLFLIGRESAEREIEWNRVRPEPTRSGAELPGLRRPLGQYPDDMLDGR